MNRGSISLQCEPKADLRGFNEAPIHESGKCKPLGPKPSKSVLLQ